MENKRNRMAARIIVVLAIITVAIGGCDSNPPGSACLDGGNPWCSNYVPPGDGGAGTGGNANVQCGSLPEFVCFGECINLLSDLDNCGSCGRSCDDGQTCNDGHCAWNSPPDQCTSSSEACNNVDDDCDGIIDEEFDLFSDDLNCGTCGHSCAAGQSCVSGHCSWDNPQDNCVPSSEACNGIDDDCDNAIDEPFNLLADANNCGICGNACLSGQHCSNGHCALNVPDNQCVPAGEICDGIDNDCDGIIDGQFNLLTDNANCGTCGHSCAAGQSCISGHCAWNTPVDQCVPAAEVCNNIDDNCNSAIDEPFNLLNDASNCGTCGRSCDVGAVCFNAVCKYNVPIDNCTPLPAELCNSKDDDCNGWVDEGFNLLTNAQHCGMCGRDCGAGAVCSNGHCQLITPVLNCTSTPEICDYTDNDCDGAIDELFILQSDEQNCGVCGLACAAGQVCDTGHCQWIIPPLNCTPVNETCNGVDDDCDSVIDDGYNLLTDPLNCGTCGRVCAGGQHCENGACAWDVPINNCTPSGEVCDNVDNNCNGFIDEGINLLNDAANCGVCGRVCPNGQSCLNGQCRWNTPVNNCTPIAETCNNIDDDCDNIIDEGFNLQNNVNHCGQCGRVCGANQHCSFGTCAWNTPMNQCVPVPETCNNTDDDCDNLIDEGFTLLSDPVNCGVCGHVCGGGQTCQNGYCSWITPISNCGPPVAEVCDNADNDCDGLIDEGYNLLTDAANCGICGHACAGGQYCENGACAWIIPVNQCVPAAEVCDNEDNNCNTLIDEGYNLQVDLGNCGTCGNSCGAGKTCLNGKCRWITPNNQCVPTGEICDGIDNDCDQTIDEGYNLLSDVANCGTCGRSCGGGQICQSGKCQYVVPPLNCTPVAEVCNGSDDDCDGVIDDGFNLLTNNAHCGICNRACAGGQTCSNGHCQWNFPQNQCVPVQPDR